MATDVELGEAGGLAYRSAGHGRPLVLLHPGPGLDGSVFFPETLALVEQGVRIVAFDVRPLRHREFRLLFVGRDGSLAGSMITYEPAVSA